MKFPLLVTLTLLSLQSVPARAEALYGLAMTGTPKYGPQSAHVDYANPDAPKGGTLKQAAIGTFDTVNPYNIKGKAAQGMDLVTDRLMARVWDEPFTMYPMIAQSVEVPADRSAITFHLNPKARFHDGSPITADDVEFTFNTLKEAGRPNMRRIYKLVAKVEKPDVRTIKFTLGEGYDRETVMILSLMPVLSKAYWTDRKFDETTLTPFLSNGAYKIKEVDVGRRVVYERVKDYWAADLLPNKGQYNFDRVIYDYYRDDSVAFESFKSGDLNLRREWDAGLWATGYDFPAITNKKATHEALQHGRPDRVRGFILNTRREPFTDIRVRQAFNLLFDFDWVNQNLYHGLYKRINSYFPNTELAATDTPPPIENKTPEQKRAHMKQADALLKEAGWIIKNGTRVNAKTGKPLTFEIMLDDPSNEKIALSLVGALKRMGITPRVRVLDSAAFLGRLNDYDFDMTLYYWMSTLSPGTEQYLYWSCEAAKSPSRWNYAGICDKNIDQLSQSIASAKTRPELVGKVQALDKALMAGSYMIPLYYNPQDYVAYWKPLAHPQTMPLYGTVLETWWMNAP
ncbi:MAG: ABC transporter substrate-binding protein [Micavibrio aeruginosavorus]|uniref:ABC transporter substrate-binding protein n=1 Tax=Micavibrio aeruginosavorus TaxID=349221 RepID=A0A2W5MZJ9_9BACT|nr:MAG: ABC transporter substrate-binding protein [Micavibrio aeruginosavorus]